MRFQPSVKPIPLLFALAAILLRPVVCGALSQPFAEQEARAATGLPEAPPVPAAIDPDWVEKNDFEADLDLDSNYDPEEESLENPLWMKAFSVTGELGYHTNPLFSAFARKPAWMAHLMADAWLRRIDLNNASETMLLTSADFTHALDQTGIPEQWFIFTIAEWKQYFPDQWTLQMTGRHVYIQQGFDISYSDLDQKSAQIRIHQVDPSVFLRKRFGETWEIAAGAGHLWEFYGNSAEDYREPRVILEASVKYGYSSQVALSIEWNQRLFIDRHPRAADGSLLAGKILRYDQPRAVLSWKHFFNEKKTLGLRSQLSVRRRDDNGPGYYDYDEYRASITVWRLWGRWRFEVDASNALNEYGVRRVSSAFSPLYRRVDYDLSGRVEWEFQPQWMAVGEVSREASDSNADGEDYTAHQFSLGLRREW